MTIETLILNAYKSGELVGTTLTTYGAYMPLRVSGVGYSIRATKDSDNQDYFYLSKRDDSFLKLEQEIVGLPIIVNHPLDKPSENNENSRRFLLSLQGYNGFRGESPDRLDAYVWGCYVLANLNFKDTEGSFFNQPLNIQERYFIIQDDIYFISYLKDTIGVIKCRVGKNKLLQKAVYIVDAFCLNEHLDFTKINDANDIFIRDLPANHYLISEATQYFSDRFTNIHLYKQRKNNTAELIYTSSHNTNNANNDDRMVKLNESIKKNLVVVDTMESKFTPSTYNGDFGNLLDNALSELPNR